MSVEGGFIGKGLQNDEHSLFFGILIPVVSDAARLLPGLFNELLEMGSGDLDSFGFDSENSNNFNVGHKICLDYRIKGQPP